jgi:hypothetical protein
MLTASRLPRRVASRILTVFLHDEVRGSFPQSGNNSLPASINPKKAAGQRQASLDGISPEA